MSDLINREDIIRLVCSEEYAKRMDGEMLGAVITLLLDTPKEELPSVEKTGKWEIVQDTEYMATTGKCSACGRRSKMPLGDFCKWCGARMVGDTE